MDGSTIGVDTATTHITDGEIYASNMTACCG